MQVFSKYDDIINSRFTGPAAVIAYRNGEVSIVSVNDKYLREIELNIPKQDYLATSLQDRLDEVNLQVYLNCVRKCIATGEEHSCETCRKMVENCCNIDHIFLKSTMVLLDKEPDGAYIFEAIRNITSEKETLNTLADIEHRYKSASEQINIYNWEYTVATKEMRPCYRCMRDLGLPALVENYPEPAIEAGIFPPDYADMYREMMRKIDAGETNLEADIPLTVGRVPFRIKYTTEYDEQGKPIKAFGSATLISETELGHIRLDNSIIASLAEEYVCIYLIDFIEDKIKIIKQDAIFEIHEDTKLKDIASFITSRVDADNAELARQFTDENFVRKELFKTFDRREYVFKDEQLNRWVRVSLHVVEKNGDDVEKLLMAASFLDDLRAQKLDDDRLIARQKEELEDRQKLLLNAIEEANRANQAKTEFFSNMSHDIRTPMSAITGFSKLALEEIDDRERLEDYLGKIISAGEHLMNLINDILDMSRIESGKMELSPSPVRLVNLFNECADMIRDEMKGKGVEFKVDTAELGEDAVYCDKLRFRQILLNLLSNAYKFTNSGGTVLLSGKLLKKEDKLTYEIRVKDSGIGMSAEFKEHIWDAFSRDESAAVVHETQGTGLGMTIVRNIVNMMQGAIDLETAPGEGSEFIIVLPLDPATAAEEVSETDTAEKEALNRRYDGKTLLVVDDTATNIKLAEFVLGKFGFNILSSTSGIDAIETVKNSKPGDIDLILMDVLMPVMDGLEATRRIRALEDPALASIPIIAMTANAFDSDIKAALDAGMNAHVSKPFRREDLVTKIAANLK